MKLTELKLLTIIADDSLEHVIEQEIIAIGAKGYTVSHVNGKGETGSRDSAWSGENVKIETIVSAGTCEKILVHLSKNYFGKYAMIAYCFDVQTIRSDHFI